MASCQSHVQRSGVSPGTLSEHLMCPSLEPPYQTSHSLAYLLGTPRIRSPETPALISAV